MKRIRTNRRNLNKSVRKKRKVKSVQLTFDQYENIICSNIPIARICNIFKLNINKQYFVDMRKNKLPEYEEWYEKVKGKSKKQ